MLAELHGEVVLSTARHRRCGLGSEYEFLRKFFVGLVVVLGLVVEAGDIEGGGESIVEYRTYLVHAAGYRTGGIELVYKILEHGQLAHASGAPLRRNLIAYRPHHHRRTVAVVLHHIGDVAFGPLVEYRAVAVGRLRTETPVVEGFNHQHHAHLIAELHKLGCRHVVGCTDGIHSHILEQFYLVAECRAVHGSTEGAEVVMIAHALELCEFAIEEESFFGYILDRTYTEAGIVAIHGLAIDRKCGLGRIERGCVEIPQLGVLDQKVLGERLSAGYIVGFIRGHFLTLRIVDLGFYRYFVAIRPFLELACAGDIYVEFHRGIFRSHFGCGDVGSPHRNVHLIGGNHMHVAV